MSTYAQRLSYERGRVAARRRNVSPVANAERRALAASQSKASEDPDSQVHGDSEDPNIRYIQRVRVLRGLIRDGIEPTGLFENVQKAALDAHADRRLIDAVDLREPRNAVEADAERRLFSSYGWDGDK